MHNKLYSQRNKIQKASFQILSDMPIHIYSLGCMHHLLHFIIRAQSLSTSSVPEWPKDTVVTKKKVRQVWMMRHSKWMPLIILAFKHAIHVLELWWYKKKTVSFIQSTFSFCFLHWWMSWAFIILYIRHTTSEHGKLLKNLHSSHSLISKSYFQYFKSLCSIFPQMKE